MLTQLTHTQVYVLDQDQALDFYVGKLGLELNTDADLGFMRWLTVSVPGDPEHQLVLTKPGPPQHDDATAEQIRELHEGGDGHGRHLQGGRRPQDLRPAARQGRGAHRGADRALLRDGLRPARPVRDYLRIGEPKEGPIEVPPPEQLAAESS